MLSTILESRPGLDKEAFRLKAQGMPMPDITKELDLPEFLVERLIRHAASKLKLDRTNRRATERAVQLARLEELYASLRQPALDGDTKACQRILEVLSRQSALLGLDAPKEETVTVKDGAWEVWVDQMKQLKAQTVTVECKALPHTLPDTSPE